MSLSTHICIQLSQILTLPPCFGTTTIPAHHSFGSVTLVMTPSLVICSSSSFTFGAGERMINNYNPAVLLVWEHTIYRREISYILLVHNKIIQPRQKRVI